MHQSSPSQQRCPTSDGHNSGDDGDMDTESTTQGNPFKEVVYIVKHLSDDKCRTGINLLLEV